VSSRSAGTAVGTASTRPTVRCKVVEVLVSQTGLAELRTAVNSFEAQAARDGLVSPISACQLADRTLLDARIASFS